MAVDAQRDRDCGVAKPLLNNPRVNAALERQCRPRLPQAVKGQPWQSVAPDLPLEGRADRIRVQRLAARQLEHEVVVCEVGTDEQPLLVGQAPVRP